LKIAFSTEILAKERESARGKSFAEDFLHVTLLFWSVGLRFISTEMEKIESIILALLGIVAGSSYTSTALSGNSRMPTT